MKNSKTPLIEMEESSKSILIVKGPIPRNRVKIFANAELGKRIFHNNFPFCR